MSLGWALLSDGPDSVRSKRCCQHLPQLLLRQKLQREMRTSPNCPPSRVIKISFLSGLHRPALRPALCPPPLCLPHGDPGFPDTHLSTHPTGRFGLGGPGGCKSDSRGDHREAEGVKEPMGGRGSCCRTVAGSAGFRTPLGAGSSLGCHLDMHRHRRPQCPPVLLVLLCLELLGTAGGRGEEGTRCWACWEDWGSLGLMAGGGCVLLPVWVLGAGEGVPARWREGTHRCSARGVQQSHGLGVPGEVEWGWDFCRRGMPRLGDRLGACGAAWPHLCTPPSRHPALRWGRLGQHPPSCPLSPPTGGCPSPIDGAGTGGLSLLKGAQPGLLASSKQQSLQHPRAQPSCQTAGVVNPWCAGLGPPSACCR